MAIINGWIDWAVKVPGIPDKIYSTPNSGEWITCHSIVGRETEFQDGIPNRFLSVEKDSSGRYTAAAAASCMFILRENGTLIQMYPITASTWTSGGFQANTRSWAVEAEGGLYPNYGEKLTEAAKKTFVKLVREWENWRGIKAVPGIHLKQHKDVALEFGTDATACASDRYSEAWQEIFKEEEEMTPEQFSEEFIKNMGKLFPIYIKAYFEKGFTVANGIVDPGELTDTGPIKPWLQDMQASLGLTDEEFVEKVKEALIQIIS